MSLAEDKLDAITDYLLEKIPQSRVRREPLQQASPEYILIVTWPCRHLRLGIRRPLIDDQNHSVAKIQQLLISDDLANEIQKFERTEYLWSPDV